MGALRDYVAKDPVTERYAVVNFPVQADNPYKIDVGETTELLGRMCPEIIIFGKSIILHPEPLAEFRKLIEGIKRRALLMYDTAHVLRLVGTHFQRAFEEGADVVTGSTHKSFLGTQQGVIGADFAEDTPEFDLWQAMRRQVIVSVGYAKGCEIAGRLEGKTTSSPIIRRSPTMKALPPVQVCGWAFVR